MDQVTDAFRDNGWPVSRSDALITNPADLKQSSNALVPLPVHLEFNYDDSFALPALQAAVDAYNQLGHVAQFELLVHGSAYELAPSMTRNASGQYVPYHSLLEEVITLPKSKADILDAIDKILGKANQDHDYAARAWRGLNERPRGPIVKLGGTRTVREHLVDALAQEAALGDGVRLWSLSCDYERPKVCTFNFAFQSPASVITTGKAAEICDPDAANDGILANVARIGTNPYTCRGGAEAVDVRNGMELWEYTETYGWDGSTFADLNILFNVQGPFDVASPCAIRMHGDDGVLDVNADKMCLTGRKGVFVAESPSAPQVGANGLTILLNAEEGPAILGPGLTLVADHIQVEGQHAASIGANTIIHTSGNVVVRSTGDTPQSSATIGPAVQIQTAKDVMVEATRVATIGAGTSIQSTGEVAIVSTGAGATDGVSIEAGASVITTGFDLVVESSSGLTVGAGATLNADITLRLDAVTCNVSGTAALAGANQTGACQPQTDPPDDHCTPFPCANNKATVCHKPGTPAQNALCVSIHAIPAHLGHGDQCGPCGS